MQLLFEEFTLYFSLSLFLSVGLSLRIVWLWPVKIANPFSYSIRQNLWSSQIVKIQWLRSRNQYTGIAVVCKLFSVSFSVIVLFAVVIPVLILLINPCLILCRRINLLVKCYCIQCIPKKRGNAAYSMHSPQFVLSCTLSVRCTNDMFVSINYINWY